MNRPRGRRAGLWLSFYAAGGTLVGILGFGLLWSGLQSGGWARAVLGVALLLLGLDRAGTALHLSMRSRRAVADRPSLDLGDRHDHLRPGSANRQPDGH